MKFYIYTLGCKVNAYESEVMKEKLLANGYIYDEEHPDIVIVNTCSVTNMADNKSKKMVRHFKKLFPKSKIVVAGCSAENKEKEYSNMDIDILIGNVKKSEIVELLKEDNYKYFAHTRKLPFEDMTINSFTTHNRAFIKIEDGCDNFCSYCIIPFTRGSIRSKDFEKVISEVKTLVEHGHKEIVLTGIHTGSYNSEGKDLTDVIHEISKIDGLERIRISSIEATELNDKFLEELKVNSKICNHLHIPIQSGSNTILKSMKRKYTLDEYEKIIDKVRNVRPNISISTDLIVGFPGESEELFKETLDTLNRIKFSKIHVFPYSKRDGTVAALMPNQIDEAIKKERSRVVFELSSKFEEEYAVKFIGSEIEVLVETGNIGTSSNYLKVLLNDNFKVNSIVKVIPKEYSDGLLKI